MAQRPNRLAAGAWFLLLALAFLCAISCSRLPTSPEGNTWLILPGHVEKLVIPAFRDGRVCWVYLPPGYVQSTVRYPVLYVNDGESVFDGPAAMHVNRICDDLIRRREIPPIIVVAIDHESGEQRYIDFMPWEIPWLGLPNGQGEKYVLAVRDTLKPEIDRRYRTLPDPFHTAMAGMSLGGLISVYAGFAHWETFGKVAGLSPTYGYGEFNTMADTIPRPRLFRWYQDTGYPDDNYIGGMETLARRLRFLEGVDFMSLTVVDAGHSAAAWQHRFGGMLKFLYTPNSAVDPRAP